MSISGLSLFKEQAEWADILHYHFPWPFMDLLHVLAGVKNKLVLTYHSDVVRQKKLLLLYKVLMNRFLGSVDVIVATSINYVRSSHTLKKYKDKVQVIPIGINKVYYQNPTKKEIEEVKNTVGKGFFLFIGTLRKYKNLQLLLDAVEGTSLHCVIAGSGPEEKKLKQYADKHSIKNVAFLGRVTDIEKASLIKLCRAIVLPSNMRSEAFGVVLLEGAMHKKPLISTSLETGTSFVNENEVTGIVIPPLSVVACREAMIRLEKEDGLAMKMGEQAYKRYQNIFTGEQMGRSYVDLYKSLLVNVNSND
jgi:rhamnosyl/mannosyltransferase